MHKRLMRVYPLDGDKVCRGLSKDSGITVIDRFKNTLHVVKKSKF